MGETAPQLNESMAGCSAVGSQVLVNLIREESDTIQKEKIGPTSIGENPKIEK